MSQTFKTTMPPERADQEDWWYERDGQSEGPVSAATIAALCKKGEIDGSTMLWRQDFGSDWKRYDETTIWRARPTLAISADQVRGNQYGVSDRWARTFARIEAGESGAYRFSCLGFFFGPFYYMYLRMWRKAFAIIGFAMIAAILVGFVDGLLHVNLGKSLPLGIDALCAYYVKSDYYRFKKNGETFWPKYAVLGSKTALASMIVVPLLLASIVESMGVSDSATPNAITTASAAGDNQPSTVAELQPGTLDISKTPDFTSKGLYNLEITSKVNAVRITSIIVNRGNCTYLNQGYSEVLHFGEVFKLVIFCNPIEVHVKTNIGESTYMMDE